MTPAFKSDTALRPAKNTLLLAEEERRFVESPFLILDDSKILVEPGFTKNRFAWEVIYRHGEIRRQYERWGEHLFCTRWPMCPQGNVRMVNVYDSFKVEIDYPVLRFEVPEDATCKFFMTCGFSLGGLCLIDRIYSFGWISTDGRRKKFHHINPSTDPPRLLVNESERPS